MKVIQTGEKVFHLFVDEAQEGRDYTSRLYKCCHCGVIAQNPDKMVHLRTCKVGMITGRMIPKEIGDKCLTTRPMP